MASLTTNTGELVTVLLSLAATAIFHTPLAILTLQILSIDLVGQLLPVTFLTWDPPQSKIMTEVPRHLKDHIFNKKTMLTMVWTGSLMGLIGFTNFLLLFYRNGISPFTVTGIDPFYLRATTLTYVTLVVVSWVNIMSLRAGSETVFSRYAWSNKRLFLGYLVSLLFVLALVYWPIAGDFLQTSPLTLVDWSYAILGGALYLFIHEAVKLFKNRKSVQKQEPSAA